MKSQLALFAVLLAHGCATAAADPAQATETRKTPAFHAIDITGTLSVEARIAPTTSVELRGDADKLKQITTEVKNGTLVLGTVGKLQNTKRLHVVVTAPSLDALAIHGTGDLEVSGLAAPRLAITIPGTGAIRIAGKTQQLAVAVDGTGDVQAKNLIAEAATMTVAGTAQATVHATRTLDLDVSGTAAVKVLGKPAVKKSITGTAAIDD
ncbi:MAG TPA: head GIN domain-containing protein [Kofleriaceae bacterium]|nr:head GIN domain-containing protein [Kofleriaceae bacterium]